MPSKDTLSISCFYHFARPGCSVSDYFTAQILNRVRSSCLNLLMVVVEKKIVPG